MARPRTHTEPMLSASVQFTASFLEELRAGSKAAGVSMGTYLERRIKSNWRYETRELQMHFYANDLQRLRINAESKGQTLEQHLSDCIGRGIYSDDSKDVEQLYSSLTGARDSIVTIDVTLPEDDWTRLEALERNAGVLWPKYLAETTFKMSKPL